MLRPLMEADTTWLAQFLSQNRWPFHAEDLGDETVVERIRNGYFNGPSVET